MSVHPKTRATDHDVLDVIRHRWSPRAFDPTRDVARERAVAAVRSGALGAVVLQRAALALRRAHVAGGTPERIRGAARVADRRRIRPGRPRRRCWCSSCVRATLERNEAPNSHAWYDTGQAVAFLTLQATSQGLSIRQMQGFDAERARAACDVPAPFEPAVVMAIGYAGDPRASPSRSIARPSTAPRRAGRSREFVFDGRWGKR